MIAFRFLVVTLMLFMADAAFACGWWGDNEMTSARNAAAAALRGHTIEENLNLKTMKLPGKMGYGIAVPKPGRAMPYLLATFGQPLTNIKDLKIFGFRSVIDLATPASTARLHRAESEAAGMHYFNILLEGEIPNEKQIGDFNEIVINESNGPLLVYASKAELISVMWAFYRLRMGSSIEFVIQEGRTLGLTSVQEALLRKTK